MTDPILLGWTRSTDRWLVSSTARRTTSVWLAEQEASGLNLIEFARERSLSPWTLYGWRRKLGRSRRRRRAAVEGGEAGFVAVDVVGAAATTGEIEVQLADGVRVRVPRDVAIARLVELVRALRSC